MRETADPLDALDDARESALSALPRSLSHAPLSLGEAVECALVAADREVIEELLGERRRADPRPADAATRCRGVPTRARLAAHRGQTVDAERWYKRSIDLFREFETPFFLARTQVEYAEIARDPQDARAAREDALPVLERLERAPWVARAQARTSEAVA